MSARDSEGTASEPGLCPAAARCLAVAGVLGLLGVVAGAFGAHAIRDSVPPRDLEIWQTGAHYQQLHAVVLVGVAILGARRWSRALHVASIALTVGIIIFAGTLYAMTAGGPRLLGAITPIGGLSLMAGWAALASYGVSQVRAGLASRSRAGES